MPTAKAIDLSHHNPEPNWPQLKAGGILGVILKATEGTSYVDPTYQARRAAALSAGFAVSSYHFFHGNAEKEMAHYLKTVAPVQGERVCIDHEAEATLQQLEDAVAYLVSVRPDLQISIYSGHLIKDQLGSKTSEILSKNTSLWVAQYNDKGPSWPKQVWPQWSLWQFTDKAKVAGISQPVDGNQFNGSDENLVKWFGPVQSEPAPSPDPDPAPKPEPQLTLIRIAIDAPDDALITITVNGKEIHNGSV